MSLRWVHGSRAMVSVNAIFAGFSGALVSLVSRSQAEPPHCNPHRGCLAFLSSNAPEIALVSAIAALLLFAFAAERTTEALDEGDVRQYIWSMELHNLGAISLLVSVSALLWMRFAPIEWFWLTLLPVVYWLRDFLYLLPRANRIAHANKISQDEPKP